MTYHSYRINVSAAALRCATFDAAQQRQGGMPCPSCCPRKPSRSTTPRATTFRSACCRRAEAASYRERLERHERGTGKPLQGNLRHKTHLLFTWADELVHNERILDAIEDVIGPDILCWTTNFFIKEANNPGFVSWHQDSTYWGLDPDDVVTAWVAFTDVTPANGYMQVIPGSHNVDQLPHVDTFHRDNLLSRGQEIAVEVDKSKAVGLALKAGRDVAAPHQAGARLGSQPDRRPPHRPRDPLHPHPRAPGQGARLRHARARHGPLRQLRSGAASGAPISTRRALAAHADAVGRQVKALYEGTSKTEFRA